MFPQVSLLILPLLLRLSLPLLVLLLQLIPLLRKVEVRLRSRRHVFAVVAALRPKACHQ